MNVLYTKEGGEAFKQHLLYMLVSAKCRGGVEQQFSMLVLSFYPGPQSLDGCPS